MKDKKELVNHLKAIVAILLAFTSLYSMWNEFFYLYKRPLQTSFLPLHIISDWYNSNPLWLIITWSVTMFFAFVLFVAPHIMSEES